MTNRCLATVALALAALAATPAFAADEKFAIEETTIADIQRGFHEHRLTCHALVQSYLDRIAAYNKQGPAINAILTLNDKALAKADALDASYAKAGPVGPLHCVPIVLKDNYNTADLPTTGGSAALVGAQPAQDAFVVGKLRAAGAIVLAKTNMHELALAGNTVSSLGGQTLNPYDLTRTPGGSSGGTGAALASNLALAGTGSDTVNSIRSPASANSLVGIRPTMGLLSRAGIMPVSETQDAIGPLARTVTDAAKMLQVMAGSDPADRITAESAGKIPHSYTEFLKKDALKGARIGVLKVMFGAKPEHAEVNGVIAKAIDRMRKAGATIVEIDEPALDSDKLIAENDVQKYEFKALFNQYLASIPNAPVKTLGDFIASGKFHKPSIEKFLTTAQGFENGTVEPDYKERLARNARTRATLLGLLDQDKLDAIIYPLQKRLVVPVIEPSQTDRTGILASVTGTPVVTVQAGFSTPTKDAPIGIPVGMDMLGRPWSEGKLLGLAYSFEQATHARRQPSVTPKLAM